LLDLEARFSFEKRVDKIVAVFPRTFAMLGAAQTTVLREFASVCRPIGLTRISNARQFYEFLLARWRHKPAKPAYLRDVAACELACATVRVEAVEAASPSRDETGAAPGSIRRRPGVVLLRCAYDIRPIFEDASIPGPPAKRATRLAIALPPGAIDPSVFELLPVVFDLLACIEDWTDPKELGLRSEPDVLIRELIEHGLIEVHG
jgi:hypothetical protein